MRELDRKFLQILQHTGGADRALAAAAGGADAAGSNRDQQQHDDDEEEEEGGAAAGGGAAPRAPKGRKGSGSKDLLKAVLLAVKKAADDEVAVKGETRGREGRACCLAQELATRASSLSCPCVRVTFATCHTSISFFFLGGKTKPKKNLPPRYSRGDP